MSRMKLLTLAIIVVAMSGCNQSPKYSNRVEMLLAEINDPNSEFVLVACHRGDWRNYPENSIPAMESCIRMGADILELDVKMTKDSQLVVIHDWTATRTMNIHPERDPGYESPRIKDLTLEQLKALRLRRAQGITTDSLRIPTLEEALACCKDRILVNIDGGINYYDMIMPIAMKLGVTEQLIIKGSKPAAEVSALMAKYPEKPMYMPICGGTNLDQINSYIDADREDDVFNPVAYEICFKVENTLEDYLPAADAIHESGARVWMNTLASMWSGKGNDDDAAFESGNPDLVYGQVIAHGINIFQTDRPQFLLDYLRSVGRHD